MKPLLSSVADPRHRSGVFESTSPSQNKTPGSGGSFPMALTSMEQTESVSDVLCDVCGNSTRVEGAAQFGTLCASWGYGSAHDGECYVSIRIGSDTNSHT